MKSKTLIPKIAFGVAAAALIFSLVTFIKTIVQGQPQYIWIAALQVVGTALIVGVCAIVIYLSKNSILEEEETVSEDSKYSSQNEEKTDQNIDDSVASEKANKKQDEVIVEDEKTSDKEDEDIIKEENDIKVIDEKDLLSDLPQVDE